MHKAADDFSPQMSCYQLLQVSEGEGNGLAGIQSAIGAYEVGVLILPVLHFHTDECSRQSCEYLVMLVCVTHEEYPNKKA